jgi:predicted amidohydrolase
MPKLYLMRFLLIIVAAIGGLTFVSPLARAQTTVAMVQLPTTEVGNFAQMKIYAQQAKNNGAQLIIFPEGSVFGWLNPAVFTQAAPIPGVYSDQFAAIAKSVNIWVAAGLAEKGPKAGAGSLPNAYQAYDSGILINPQGQIVLHHRKFNVLQNAFDPLACQSILNQPQCAYTPGSLSDITTVQTPFGKTALLVCSDAYTYAPATALATLKALTPGFVIVPWGITAGTQASCGTPGFNATGYASEAAAYLKSAFVVGANAVGPRNYGRYLPSVYCGDSGYATPTGRSVEVSQPTEALVLLTIPGSFDASAGPIWNNGDAGGKCPPTCNAYKASWNGQWKTTIPGQMSVCGCVPPAAQ